MEYNKKLFELAEEYGMVKQNGTKDIDKGKKKKLLNILLEDFEFELDEPDMDYSGVISTRICKPYKSQPDEGYGLIKSLVDSNSFEAFGNQYCFYLGDVKTDCTPESDAYYEIIWNYRAYYQIYSLGQMSDGITTDDVNLDKYKAIFSEFAKLPVKYQIKSLKAFSSKIKECIKSNSHDHAVSVCERDGHEFTEWKEDTSVRYINTVIDHMPVEGLRVENSYWHRKCTRCGYYERVEEEPIEAKQKREEKEKQQKIKSLRKQLAELEGK